MLEDSFAAGHLRTPRLSIETYMSAHESSAIAQLGGEIEGSVVSQIDAATAHLPEIGVDTLVAELTHDEDNADGVWVTNDLGEKWLTFGDSHGGTGKDPPTAQAATKTHVEAAVRLRTRAMTGLDSPRTARCARCYRRWMVVRWQ